MNSYEILIKFKSGTWDDAVNILSEAIEAGDIERIVIYKATAANGAPPTWLSEGGTR